jgi:hypothetical protein
VIGVSGAAVAHGKSHTVPRRYINVVKARAALDGAATSWPMIADGGGLVAQSGGSEVRLAYLIAAREHGVIGGVAGELGMETVYAAIPFDLLVGWTWRPDFGIRTSWVSSTEASTTASCGSPWVMCLGSTAPNY